jgi:hypothetical protein
MVAIINRHFSLGKTVLTPGALKALQEANQTPLEFLERHQNADWGDLEIGDKAANERAMVEGDRIWSKYTLTTGQGIWVITEGKDDDGERTSTTILLPHEY